MAKYVGKRIVPKHCGYWDMNQAYEMECIVYDQASGNSYISRKAVPAGTLISQTDYWALCSDFNEQMYLLNQHVTQSEAAIRADNDATEAAIKADNDATEAAIKSDTAAKKAEIDNRMAAIETRQEANVRASTDADADYAAEVVDARVDDHGKTRTSLGDNIRGGQVCEDNLADYLASFTYENVLYIDGTLEIQQGIFYNKDGTTKEWQEFDAVKLPVKRGDRYCVAALLSIAMYKGETCLGYLPYERIDGVSYFAVTEDIDYIWVPLHVNSYGKMMFIKGSYYPPKYIQPGKKYTLLENREFLPVRGSLGDYDLNDINESGIHLLVSSHSYENMPDGPNAGFLFTLYDAIGGKTGAQIFYTFTTGVTYYRTILLGEWRPWRNNTLQMSEVEAKLNGAVQSLHKDMRAFGVEDLLHRNLKLVGREMNGITFSFDTDGYLTVTGTAEDLAFNNVYGSSTEIPAWLERGKEYIARINDPDGVVNVEIFAYTPENTVVFPALLATASQGTFVIPEDSPGLIIRYRVRSGLTANARLFPSISEKYTPEEYYEKAVKQSETDRRQLSITTRTANQIRTFRQYNFWECEKMENGYKRKTNEWVENEAFDSYFMPITNDDRFYFTRTNTSILLADKDKNIVGTALYAEQRTCPIDGSDDVVTFWCHEMPYVEDAVYLEVISSKSTNGYLRSSNQKDFLPFFDIGAERGACKAYDVAFLGDTLISTDSGGNLGEFEEDMIKLLGVGESYHLEGFYTTSTLFIKKGTILDVSCTNLLLNIRGWTSKGIMYRYNQTRFEFPADFVGFIDYHLGSWNWPDDTPDIAPKDEHFFIRVITPEEQKSNPWMGKVWYSYGTSISDIGIGDVVGNRGHSGKWPLYLDAVSGMERRNGAIGSGGIREGAAHGANVKAALLQTPYDCDLVTLEVLPNDGYGSADGEITDTDPTTICGAFRECCEYITKHTRAKFAVLFVVGATSNRNNNYADYAPMSSSHLAYRNSVEKLKKIAEYYGVIVIDAEKEAANYWHSRKDVLMRDQIHLNYLGGEVYGKYIWKKIREMDPYPVMKDISDR